jgi:hypothetical protein
LVSDILAGDGKMANLFYSLTVVTEIPLERDTASVGNFSPATGARNQVVVPARQPM